MHERADSKQNILSGRRRFRDESNLIVSKRGLEDEKRSSLQRLVACLE